MCYYTTGLQKLSFASCLAWVWPKRWGQVKFYLWGTLKVPKARLFPCIGSPKQPPLERKFARLNLLVNHGLCSCGFIRKHGWIFPPCSKLPHNNCRRIQRQTFPIRAVQVCLEPVPAWRLVHMDIQYVNAPFENTRPGGDPAIFSGRGARRQSF